MNGEGGYGSWRCSMRGKVHAQQDRIALKLGVLWCAANRHNPNRNWIGKPPLSREASTQADEASGNRRVDRAQTSALVLRLVAWYRSVEQWAKLFVRFDVADLATVGTFARGSGRLLRRWFRGTLLPRV